MRTIKTIAVTVTVFLSLMLCLPTAAEAATRTASCTNVTWAATFDRDNVNAETELALIRRAFTRAGILFGVSATYIPIGYDFKTETGEYAGYDYVPSPPTTRTRNSNAPAILFTVTDLPDTVLEDGTVALGNASMMQGRMTGTYDSSALMQHSPSLRTDYYYVTVQAYLQGCVATPPA